MVEYVPALPRGPRPRIDQVLQNQVTCKSLLLRSGPPTIWVTSGLSILVLATLRLLILSDCKNSGARRTAATRGAILLVMRALCLALILCAGNGVAQISPKALDVADGAESVLAAFLALLDSADQQVVRLSPTDFQELPTNVRAELQRRGCTIPQVPMVEGHHNVIKGEFEKPGQTDWAVLCSVRRVSSILIFWNGSTETLTSLAEMKDIDRLQSWTEGRIVYSRLIRPVGKSFIDEHYAGFGGPTPPPIDHQGVDDAFWGKASGVHYLFQGSWLRLQGGD